MFVLILISKENMALWMVFIGFGLIVLHRKEFYKLKYISLFTILSILYFITVMKFVMPALANEGREYIHFEYSALGQSFSEVLSTIIKKPGFIFGLLLENHLNVASAIGVKSELHFVVLLSGGVFLFLKPQYLIMLIPIYAQKLFNDDHGKWGINYQYSIEFAPIITIVAFSWIIEHKQKMRAFLISILLVGITISTTLNVLDMRISTWYNAINHQFYAKDHYVRDFDVDGMHQILDKIPDDAIVSAQTMLVPHIAFRDRIYQFPDVSDAEYIVLLTADNNTYPLKKEKYEMKVEKYRYDKDWEIFFETDFALIFKRRSK